MNNQEEVSGMNDPQESRRGVESASSGGDGGDSSFVGAGIVGGGVLGSGINFIGADGSVLDKLPSGMEMVMDSEAMCSLDYSLGSLTTMSSAPGLEEEGQQKQQQPPPPSPPQHQHQVKLEEGNRWPQPRVSVADGWALHSTPTPARVAPIEMVIETKEGAGSATSAAERGGAGVRTAASNTQSSPSGRGYEGSRCRGDNCDASETNRHGEGGSGSEACANTVGGASKCPKARGGKKRKKEDDGGGGGGGGDGVGEGDADGDGDGEAEDGGGKATEEVEDPNENPKQRAK